MLWVGLTGGLGSGKTTVSSLLKSLGFAVIDADAISHQQLVPKSDAYIEILKDFGPGILNPDETIHRKKLGDIVFKNALKRQKLEQILHPKIQQRVLELKKELSLTHEIAFYDVPLLFEKKLEKNFDAILVVDCPLSLRLQRVMERNGWTQTEALNRIAAQLPLEEKVLKTPYVIKNDGDLEQLKLETQRVLKLLF